MIYLYIYLFYIYFSSILIQVKVIAKTLGEGRDEMHFLTKHKKKQGQFNMCEK